jgi:hypothetical protein
VIKIRAVLRDFHLCETKPAQFGRSTLWGRRLHRFQGRGTAKKNPQTRRESGLGNASECVSGGFGTYR